MCFMKAPKISTEQVVAPPALPEPEDAPKVESVQFGGSADSDTETASGVKGMKAKGKSSLKIAKPTAPKTGVNVG